MPTYVYKCPKCGSTFDKIIPSIRRSNINCPMCGAHADQQMTSCHFRLAYEEPHGVYSPGEKAPAPTIKQQHEINY
jgi:putative FmdB family regulatory protein